MPGRGEFWKVAGTNKDGVDFEQLTTSLQQQITGGGAHTGHVIENELTPLAARPALNFTGAGVVASDDGERTNVTIAGGGGGHVIEDEGTPLAQQTNLNFVGAGVTATDSGGKTVVTIPGVPTIFYQTMLDEGIGITQQGSLNFVGAGVSAVAGGENTTIVTIPAVAGNGHVIEDEGTPLAQQTNMNFVGAGVTAIDSGGKTVVTIPGILPLLSFVMAASDETTDLTTGDAKLTFRMPYAFTITEVRASVTDAPTGAVITVNIRLGGVDILSTPLTIDAGELTSETAVTPPVIGTSALTDDGEIKIDLDTIGSILAGKGLKVTLIGNPT